ncbi:YqcC family protein [Erwinia endophytica]|uniref:YqcC family protein n=1 Tax=Erwinia endophytica TaxID=1563158 RepID=UPI001265E43D|nr:YqcC family protein [Erwinia endophytica]KAB8305263.1 YqcC family protein [Erwinia endophytica]
MQREQQIRERLEGIERVIHDAGLWESGAPDTDAFSSQQPFCLDTMLPVQWLQWVFLPRMRAILNSGVDLPTRLAIAPYFEMALESDIPGRATLLYSLNQLDQLFEPTP